MSDNTVVNDRENTVVINGTSSETVVYINEATVLKDTVSGYILLSVLLVV